MLESIRARLIVFFMALTAIGALVSGIIVYSSYLRFLDETIVTRLSSAVFAAELSVDFTRSKELFQEDSDQTDYYLESLETIHFLNDRLGMEYIYTLSQDENGTWFFLVDSGDYIQEDEEELTFLYELEEMYDGLVGALDTGELFVEDEYFTDEWGTFRSAFLPVYDAQGNLAAVIGADIEASEVNATKRNILLLFLGAVAISVVVTGMGAIWISGMIVRPLDRTTESLQEIASGHGDLTKRLRKDRDDELGRMVDRYNRFLDMMNDMLSRIVDSTTKLRATGADLKVSMGDSATSVEEIVANIFSVNRQIDSQTQSVGESSAAVAEIHSKIDKLGDVVGEQAASVTESSAAIEQMVGNIKAVSTNMGKLSDLFSELKVVSDDGKTKIGEVLSQVNSISTQSETLQEANTIIASIASKTNLLAMNAAIEAAHAGEAGRGFSVVADEIRKLAEQSAEQSKAIGSSLNGVLDSIGAVVETTSETEKTFEKVINHVQLIGPLETEVKDALKEQESGSGQILEALDAMNQVTADVRDGSNDIRRNSDLLQSIVVKLKSISTEVRQSMDEIQVGAEGIQRTTARGMDLVGENQNSIDVVSGETNKFKLRSV